LKSSPRQTQIYEIVLLIVVAYGSESAKFPEASI
jgi:hypothetical protein